MVYQLFFIINFSDQQRRLSIGSARQEIITDCDFSVNRGIVETLVGQVCARESFSHNIVSRPLRDEEGHTETFRVFHSARSGRIENRGRFTLKFTAELNTRSSESGVSSNIFGSHSGPFHILLAPFFKQFKIDVIVPLRRDRLVNISARCFCNNNLNFRKGVSHVLSFPFPIVVCTSSSKHVETGRYRKSGLTASKFSDLTRSSRQFPVDSSRFARLSRSLYWRASRVSVC